jgi:putative peptidoglycan lipid II flippase
MRRALHYIATAKGRGAGFSLMSMGNLLAAVLMYFRQAQIASLFGTDWRTDAFAVALAIPVLLREVIANSLGSTFLPVYSEVVARKGPAAGEALVNRLVSWLVVTGVVLTGVLVLFLKPFVTAAGPGLSPDAAELASTMMGVLVPTLLLSTVTGILQGLYNYQKRYGMTALLRVTEIGVSLILVMTGEPLMGVMVMPGSVLAGVFAAFALSVAGASRLRFRFRPTLDTRDEYLGRQVRMALPVLAGTLLGLLSPLVGRAIASFMAESSVTALEYVDRMVKIALSVVFVPVMTLADTGLSALAADRDLDGFRREMRSLLQWCSFGMMPVAVFLTLGSGLIVSVLFQRGSFTSSDTRLVSWGLLFYAPWLAQFGFGSILQRGFYSLKDTLTPILLGLWGMVANLLLCVILVQPLGIGGLALAGTVSSLLKTGLLLWFLRRKAGGLGGRAILADHMRILAASMAAGACMWAVLELLPASVEAPFAERALSLSASLAAGACVYLLSSVLMRSGAALALVSRLKTSRG